MSEIPDTISPVRKRRLPSAGWCLLIGIVVIVLGVTIPLAVRIAQLKHQIALIYSCEATVELSPTAPAWVYGYINYDIALLVRRVDCVDLNAEVVPENVLQATGRFRDLQGLWLDGCKFTDPGLSHISELSQLKELSLRYSNVTDNGMQHLHKLNSLELLYLSDTGITDAGLSSLRHLTGLTWLELNDTKITDAGLVHLRGLGNLYSLDLNRTAVTDESLHDISRLPLERQYLAGTRITDQGLRQLSGLSKLVVLNLTDTSITGAGLVHLGKLRNVSRITSRI